MHMIHQGLYITLSTSRAIAPPDENYIAIVGVDIAIKRVSSILLEV